METENYVESYESEGVTYYFERLGNNRVKVTDIEVKSGVKAVHFDSIGTNSIVNINIQNDASFPDVETLCIGKDVNLINIFNKLFPNVKHVKSKSHYFKNNTSMLCCRDYSYDGWRLMNSFCKAQDEVMDFKDVESIDSIALDGCLSHNIINTDNLCIKDSDEFKGYQFDIDEKTNAKIFGDMIVSIDKDAEVVELPDDRYRLPLPYNDTALFSTKNKAVKIHDYETISIMHDIKMPETIIIDNKEKYISESCAKLPMLIKTKMVSYIEVNEDNQVYAAINGILYTKDKKNLLACPYKKSGDVVIPEGVEIISKKAFASCNIKSVTMPNSLKHIEEKAFAKCHNLKTVKLNDDLSSIGVLCFFNCSNLKSITIPSGIKVVPESCFADTMLDEVVFYEGLEIIKKKAFSKFKGKTVSFPCSLDIVEESNFIDAEILNVKGKIPHGLLTAIMDVSSESPVAEINTDKGSIYVPRVCDLFTGIGYVLSCIENMSLDYIIKNIDYNEFLNYIPCNPLDVERRYKSYLIMYEKTRNIKIRDRLKKVADDYARILVCNEDEDSKKDLIRLLNTGFVKNLTELLNIAQENNSTQAVAYILQALENNGTNKYGLLSI